MPCVMGSWIAWPTVGQDKKVVQKSVFLVKRSRSAIQLFGVADQLTLCNLCFYFVLNHIIDNYNTYLNMAICLVDPVHLSYDFIIIN